MSYGWKRRDSEIAEEGAKGELMSPAITGVMSKARSVFSEKAQILLIFYFTQVVVVSRLREMRPFVGRRSHPSLVQSGADQGAAVRPFGLPVSIVSLAETPWSRRDFFL
jgi:hypothetical protein